MRTDIDPMWKESNEGKIETGSVFLGADTFTSTTVTVVESHGCTRRHQMNVTQAPIWLNH
ncbi:MAG: hypothetical protein ACLSAF_16455 [Intestinimonas sp.]